MGLNVSKSIDVVKIIQSRKSFSRSEKIKTDNSRIMLSVDILKNLRIKNDNFSSVYIVVGSKIINGKLNDNSWLFDDLQIPIFATEDCEIITMPFSDNVELCYEFYEISENEKNIYNNQPLMWKDCVVKNGIVY